MTENFIQLWFGLASMYLSIQSFTEQLALLTTEITAIVVALAALSYVIGVALMSNAATHIVPSMAEHGQRLKNDSIKALFHIGIYSGVANLVTWVVALLNRIN